MQDALPAIEKTGAGLAAISPMQKKYSKQMADRHEIGFPLLLDPGNRMTEAFGLRYVFPDYLRKTYRQVGIDIPRFNGDDSWALPLPARYIIGPDRTILDAEVSADYTERPEPDVTVARLRELTAGT